MPTAAQGYGYLETVLHDHLGSSALSFLRSAAQQRAQLGEVDVVVQLAGSRKVVLNDSTVQHCGPISCDGTLVWPQLLCKAIHLYATSALLYWKEKSPHQKAIGF